MGLVTSPLSPCVSLLAAPTHTKGWWWCRGRRVWENEGSVVHIRGRRASPSVKKGRWGRERAFLHPDDNHFPYEMIYHFILEKTPVCVRARIQIDSSYPFPYKALVFPLVTNVNASTAATQQPKKTAGQVYLLRADHVRSRHWTGERHKTDAEFE